MPLFMCRHFYMVVKFDTNQQHCKDPGCHVWFHCCLCAFSSCFITFELGGTITQHLQKAHTLQVRSMYIWIKVRKRGLYNVNQWRAGMIRACIIRFIYYEKCYAVFLLQFFPWFSFPHPGPHFRSFAILYLFTNSRRYSQLRCQWRQWHKRNLYSTKILSNFLSPRHCTG